MGIASSSAIEGDHEGEQEETKLSLSVHPVIAGGYRPPPRKPPDPRR